MLNSRNSAGIDLNPLALLLARVKTTPIEPRRLTKTANELINFIYFNPSRPEIPNFFNIDYWFRPPVIQDLAKIKLEIEKIEEPERRKRLWEITKRMQKEFKKIGFNIGKTQTPIIPIYVGDDMKCFVFWRILFDEGIFTNPIISPAVSPGSQLLRTSYTATHTDEQMDRVLEVFQRAGKKMGVI